MPANPKQSRTTHRKKEQAPSSSPCFSLSFLSTSTVCMHLSKLAETAIPLKEQLFRQDDPPGPLRGRICVADTCGGPCHSPGPTWLLAAAVWFYPWDGAPPQAHTVRLSISVPGFAPDVRPSVLGREQPPRPPLAPWGQEPVDKRPEPSCPRAFPPQTDGSGRSRRDGAPPETSATCPQTHFSCSPAHSSDLLPNTSLAHTPFLRLCCGGPQTESASRTRAKARGLPRLPGTRPGPEHGRAGLQGRPAPRPRAARQPPRLSALALLAWASPAAGPGTCHAPARKSPLLRVEHSHSLLRSPLRGGLADSPRLLWLSRQQLRL